ncbi:hypothetical protein TEA_002452 [Camellia sinensis var. sinensis]|uniref:Phosphofructokinase domain-containing protein n=1 Tax=Camellia sinensis var. sinensis TaxID=542762 RepID=A0A4S4DBM4_CAMSN|nr:hypothetical protein TEA_002452 [Camellia sinensis var. sinensis]
MSPQPTPLPTHRHNTKIEIKRRGLKVAVAGIPKTIDNDIPVIDKSFGFDAGVEETQRAINAAHVEAESFENGVGVVKLMGRYSGPGGLFEFMEKRLKENGHMVIVIAEGAGQELLSESMHTMNQQDASENKLLEDVGLWISQKIKTSRNGTQEQKSATPGRVYALTREHAKATPFVVQGGHPPDPPSIGPKSQCTVLIKVRKTQQSAFAMQLVTGQLTMRIAFRLKLSALLLVLTKLPSSSSLVSSLFSDPTYMIRAIPSIASDNVNCTLLAQSAIHGAMAGYTGFTVGPVNGKHAYIPFYNPCRVSIVDGSGQKFMGGCSVLHCCWD